MYMENHDKEEILEAIGLLADHMQRLTEDVSGLKQDVSGLKQDVTYLKSQMVTKDYLDRKIFELRGEFVYRFRKSEMRFEALVEEGVARKMYPREIADRILALDPEPGARR